MLNITFVTMMFGSSLPVLFPIALASFVVLFVVEIWMLHYGYRQPPQYDETLNNFVLEVMRYAPLFLLSFSYWFFSSKQLFRNKHLEEGMERSSEAADTGHGLIVALTIGLTRAESGAPGSVLFILFWLYFVGAFYGSFRRTCLKSSKRLADSISADGIEENIDLYHKCICKADRTWSLEEERNCREVLGIRCMFDETIDLFTNKKQGRFQLAGVHTYDILRHPGYLQQFQYVSTDTPNRAAVIQDGDDDQENNTDQSDNVRLALSLAYRTE